MLTCAQVADSYLHPHSTLAYHQKVVARGWQSPKHVFIPLEAQHRAIVQEASHELVYTPKGLKLTIADAVRLYAHVRYHAIDVYGDKDGADLIRLWYKAMAQVFI